MNVEAYNFIHACNSTSVERLDNYIVVVSMDKPSVTTATGLDDYARCGQYEGTPSEVSTIDCTPGTIGRYVYVYLPSSNYLTLCEVEVYGERTYPS